MNIMRIIKLIVIFLLIGFVGLIILVAKDYYIWKGREQSMAGFLDILALPFVVGLIILSALAIIELIRDLKKDK